MKKSILTIALALAAALLITAAIAKGASGSPEPEVVVATASEPPAKKATVKRKPVKWTPSRSRQYAYGMLSDYGWGKKQFKCLVTLWNRESNWNHKSWNPVKVNGKHAGGIPQILGLDPNTPVPHQIKRGLDYIKNRKGYGTPCRALQFSYAHGWY